VDLIVKTLILIVKESFMFPSDSSEVYVSRVMQKVFFEINEDGSEAAASTGRTNKLLRNEEEGWWAAWRLGCSAPSGLFSLVSASAMEGDGARVFICTSISPFKHNTKEKDLIGNWPSTIAIFLSADWKHS
jgi:hypothetical protein